MSDQSSISPLLIDLATVPSGSYKVKNPWWDINARGGWLSVTHERDGNRSIMWTTGREQHCAHSTAFSIDFTPEGVLKCYMESALSMHIKWGYGRGGDKEYATAVEAVAWIHEKLKEHMVCVMNQQASSREG